MTGNRQLTALVKFLNLPPSVGKQTVMGQMYDQAKSKEWNDIRMWMTHLVAPRLILPPEAPRWLVKEHFRVLQYLKPQNVLRQLLIELAKQKLRIRWRLDTGKRGKKMILQDQEVPGVVRRDQNETPHGKLWFSVAALLETGDISKLGLCPICRKFFVKSRWFQKVCNKKTCRRAYDSQQSVERKARARAIAAKQSATVRKSRKRRKPK